MPLSRRTPWLLLAIPFLVSAAPEKAGPGRLRILVPAYFYPDGDGLKEWDRLFADTGKKIDGLETLVIVNPASGPGDKADPSYASIMARFKKSSLVPIGYVATSYARKPIAAVEAEIDRWLHFYPGIRGIFFDEQASGADKVDYQAKLYAYVRKTRGLEVVVANPGTTCDESFVARPTSDVVCLYEGPLKPESYVVPAWTKKYPASRFCVLIYGLKGVEPMRANVRAAIKARFGCLFMTDEPGAMPWGRLPTYWEKERAGVAPP